jgi:hypothetical protein
VIAKIVHSGWSGGAMSILSTKGVLDVTYVFVSGFTRYLNVKLLNGRNSR